MGELTDKHCIEDAFNSYLQPKMNKEPSKLVSQVLIHVHNLVYSE